MTMLISASTGKQHIELTVRSCAVEDLYPRSLMIEGRKREMPYSGQVIPQYTLHGSVNDVLNAPKQTELTE